ncbi:hypothetical protein QYE76_014406 [Lolium multiflorum]|uniref:Retrotransposon gag domain-containing protein n=1 Tax=Lolium multiflorum TaxID=4521 RepID=A0AAD8U622_LOLMU|nr:hypothetical protein QYE76_014406 [Lolium multiflorum]
MMEAMALMEMASGHFPVPVRDCPELEFRDGGGAPVFWSFVKLYEEEPSIARGEEEQLDQKMDVKLDMELDMKTSHGRAREEREECARGKTNDHKLVNQENKDSADIITWREFEALRNEMRREFRAQDDVLTERVEAINQKLDTTNTTVTTMADQVTDIQRSLADMRLAIENNDTSPTFHVGAGILLLRRITFRHHQPSTCFLAPPGSIKPWFLSEGKLATVRIIPSSWGSQRTCELHAITQQQQDDDEDPELQDDAHNARGAPRGNRPRGWAPLGRNGRGPDEEDGLGKPKFSIPKFEGGADVEEYLTWELKIEKIWNLHPHYTEDRKIKLASSEFDGYALRWWDAFVRNRDEDGEQPIRTWRAMKEAMTSRFVPTNYLRNIFDKLTLLRQGVKTVDEYYMEMEMLMQRGCVRESLKMRMQRFLNGLKYEIKGIVRHYSYTNMNQLLHHAREAESQLAEEAKVKGRATGAGRFTPRAPSSTGAFDALRSLLYSA